MLFSTRTLFCSLFLIPSVRIPALVAAPVVKPMPFEDEYITEIAAIDYPEERIEAYTDEGMVEYIRDKRAEPSPSPTFWPIEEIVTTTRYPILDEDGVIEIIRDKREADHAVMFRPVKGYITTTRYPLLEGEGSIQIVRNKRKAVEPGTKFWPVREIITTTRRPFRKGHPQSVRNRRAEPSPSSKPYLKEYITSEPYGSKPYLQEEYITTVTYPVYDKFYNTGYFIRPKRAAGGFFQQCLAKLVGVGVGVALVAALIYYFWYRRLKKAKQQQSEEAAEYEERQAFAKRRSSRRPTRGDDLESDYHYQASPG